MAPLVSLARARRTTRGQIHHGTASSASPAGAWVVHPVRATEPHTGEELAVSSVSHRGFTHLGLDVSKDSIAVAVLAPDRDRAPVEKIFHDEVSVRRLIDRFGDRSKLWACYEAGPTGYELYRLLGSAGGALRCGRPVVDPQAARRSGQDRQARRAASGRVCIARVNSPRSGSHRRPRKRCGICAARAVTWSRT